MGFKEWWKKLKFSIKGLIFGISFGFIIYFLNFTNLDKLVGNISLILFCNILRLESGEPCAFGFLYTGWIFLAIAFGLVGFIIGIIAQKFR